MVKEYQSATQEIFLKLKKYFYNSSKDKYRKKLSTCVPLYLNINISMYYYINACSNKHKHSET